MLAAHSDRLLEDGRAGVVRNGHLPEREIQTGIGPVTVQIPKVRAKTGSRLPSDRHWCRCMSGRPNHWKRRCPGFTLKGVSTGEMSAALEVLAGPGGQGVICQHGIAIEACLGGRIPGGVRSR